MFFALYWIWEVGSGNRGRFFGVFFVVGRKGVGAGGVGCIL